MLQGQFLTYLKYEKRYSALTIGAYQKDLIQFSDFLKRTTETESVEAQHVHVRDYIVFMMEQGQTAATIGRKISALRSYYKYLLRNGHILNNPMALVRVPKIPKKLPVFIEEQKLNDLLDVAEAFSNDFSGQRDKLVIEMLFGTGIRLAELIGIEEQDINFFEKTVKVLGKRNKERIIPIPSPLVFLLKEYLNQKSLHFKHNITTRLVVTNKGTEAYSKFIYRIVNKYLAGISTQEKRSPHVLRHSYATSLLNGGADLNAIKELLGHASLAATQVYVHNSVERLKTIYKQAHPKA